MSIIATDPNSIAVGSHNVGRPITDLAAGSLCEGEHWLWQQHGQLALQWLPDVEWVTSATSPTIIPDNDTTAKTQRLGYFNLGPGTWRVNAAGNHEVDVLVIGRNLDLTVQVADAGGVLASTVITIGGFVPALGIATLTWAPSAFSPAIYFAGELINAADKGGITAIRVQGSPSAPIPAKIPR